MPVVESPAPNSVKERKPVYNQIFWLAYAANITLVTANALTFRFAELVAYLGGTERVAGAIVGVGLGGALAARLFLGQAIDRYGVRGLWMLSGTTFIVSCAAFLVCRDITLLIFLARIGFSVSIAGMFTCSIVHIQNQVPASRRTEVIGNLGSSGFVGMIVGAQIGDGIFNAFPAGRPQFQALFGGTVALGVLYLLLVAFLTRRDVHVRPHSTPPAHKLVFRFWPGNIVLVALMMGISLTVTTVFLTRYATHLGFSNVVGTFFTGYAICAFAFRIGTRHWGRTRGRHQMVLYGLAGHAVAHALLPFMQYEWQFLIPAAAGGFGHALLFPAVVSKGAGQFPKRYRGSGTTLVLGFVDLGTALFAPVLGGIIDYAGFQAMFFTSAAVSASIAVLYAVTTARKPDVDRSEEDSVLQQPPAEYDDGDERLSAKEEESVAIPFPHVGRS